jgi:prepilin-type N-terminal cleavage/methylation domain-containing protein
MTIRFKHTSSRLGFSLIEVIMVLALFSFVFFIIVALKSNVDVLKNLSTQKLISRQDVEQTFQIMTSEIRSAAVSSIGSYPLITTTSSTFSFYSDIDHDNLFEQVTYSLSSSTIIKTVIKPIGNPLSYPTSTQIISSVVEYVVLASSTPLFQYFDSSYTGTEDALSEPISISAVRSVLVSFYTDLDPGVVVRPVFFQNFVTIRNLRSN